MSTAIAPPAETEIALPPTSIRKVVLRSRIVKHPEIQVRTKMCSETVKRYEAIIAEHGFMDPLVVFVPDLEENTLRTALLILADGWHRDEAYAGLGKDRCPVEFKVGGKSEALEYSMSKNARNGLVMTNADKRRAAELAVVDERMGKWDDKKIAKKIGTSVSLVNDCRRGLKPADKKDRKRESTAASGKRETESPAPRTTTVREHSRTVAERPTKKQIMCEIEKHLELDMIDEHDLLALFEHTHHKHTWTKRPGEIIQLKVAAGNGRVLLEIPVVIKDIGPELIAVKYEGEQGKLRLESPPA